MNRARVFQVSLTAFIAVLLLALPRILPEMYVHRVTEVLGYALFAVSFNLLFGYAGLLPFGHAAGFGVGAYTVALIFKNYPATPLLLTLLVAVLATLAAVAVIGLFCVRLKGSYFALISLSFQMFLLTVAMKWRSLTYGDDGLTVSRPDLSLSFLGTISLKHINNLYYFTLILVALGVAACYLFLKTPLGNAVVCTREKDIRASFLGYNVFLTRYAAFLVAGTVAGLSGAVFVLYQEYLATSCLNVNMSMSAAFMTVIGGAGTFFGPVFGAAFYVLFQDWVSSLTVHWWMLMGIIFVGIVMYMKGGIISLFPTERIRVWMRGGGDSK
jgi:branched-chain amino acid transport system permease protein